MHSLLYEYTSVYSLFQTSTKTISPDLERLLCLMTHLPYMRQTHHHVIALQRARNAAGLQRQVI